ncbi:hypothetical protein GCM10009775_07470 [Microbacterium aoyamense]|uniref:HTH lacI-type domain-containing protein n=2 Tax=Microbacterium aoyamense TaxID=344166 RepID=A0ABN2PCX0_9MICO
MTSKELHPAGEVGRRVRLADVALRAGVAASTASAALNDRPSVLETTKLRVLAAAEELGYRGPDPRALALRTGSSSTVCILPDTRLMARTPDRVFVVLQQITATIGQVGGFVLWLPHATEENLRRVGADAALSVGPVTQPARREMRRRGIPLAIVYPDFDAAAVTRAVRAILPDQLAVRTG